jgi:hypothetical protein
LKVDFSCRTPPCKETGEPTGERSGGCKSRQTTLSYRPQRACSCRPTINFRHLSRSRINMVDARQLLDHPYLYLLKSKQLTARRPIWCFASLEHDSFKPRTGSGRCCMLPDLFQPLHLRLHFYQYRTPCGYSIFAHRFTACSSDALEQVHAPAVSHKEVIVCVSACRSHGEVDIRGSYPSELDMLISIERAVYLYCLL